MSTHFSKTADMNTNYLSKTGDKCPITGEWLTLEDNSTMVFIKEGEFMPPFKGRSVNWQLKSSFNQE